MRTTTTFWIRAVLSAVTAFSPQLARTQQTAALRVGDFTRISSAGRSAQGKVAWIGRDSITIVKDKDAAAVTVPVFASDTVWTRHAQAGRGALVGAGFGGLALGALAGAATSGLCDAADCSGAFWPGFLVGGAIGAAGGAFVGAVIGSFVPRWRRVRP